MRAAEPSQSAAHLVVTQTLLVVAQLIEIDTPSQIDRSSRTTSISGQRTLSIDGPLVAPYVCLVACPIGHHSVLDCSLDRPWSLRLL